MARSALAAAAFLALLSVVAPVSAQVRVAVVPFEGNGAPGARRDVQRAIDGDRRVTVVDLERVDQTAGRVGAGSAATTGLTELASELEARLVVQGTVDGRGRRREVLLIARDANGNEVGRETAQMRGRGVQNGVRQLLDTAIPRLPAARQESAEAPPEAAVGPSGGARDDEQPARWGEAPAVEPETPVAAWENRAPLVNVQLGIVGRGRDADVTFASGSHGRYTVFPYAELTARAEVRPLSRMSAYAAGLFVRGDGAFAVALNSKYMGTDVSTSYWRASFDVGYGLPLGDLAEVGVAFGAGWESYGLSSPGVTLPVASVEYVYLRPAVRGRIRLYREYLVLDAESGVRPVLSRGDFQTTYGGGDTIGWDIDRKSVV